MPHLKALSIRTWLFVTPIVAIALFAILVFLTIDNFRNQEETLSEFQTNAATRLENIAGLTNNISQTHVELFAILGAAGERLDEGQIYDLAKSRLNNLFEIETRLLEHREEFVQPATDQDLFDRLIAEFKQYRVRAISTVLMTSVQLDNAKAHMAQANNNYKALNSLLADLTAASLARAKTSMQRLGAEARRFSGNLILILTTVAGLSLFVALFISHRLSRHLDGIIKALKTLAKGNTAVDLPMIDRADEIGEIARATSVFRKTLTQLNDEIAERKKVADALRAERNFVDAVNDTVGALVVVMDEGGRIVRFNRACEEVSGYRFEDVQGKKIWDILVPGADVPRCQDLISELPALQRQKLYECQWLTKSGDHRLISWAITTMQGPNGTKDFLIWCGVDSTERKDAEDRLRQSQKMEAVGQLTGGIAHDFNNLLAVIMGNLELLEDVFDEHHQAERARLTSAKTATDRGAALTQRLLAFARKQALEPKSIDLNRLVVGMEDLLRRTLAENIGIEFIRSQNLWHCEVDPVQLENVLLNLAINARDAMPEGGNLTIETANIRLDDEYAAAQENVPPGQYVLLAVSDTGTGMSDETVKKVFDPFFTTKEAGTGSGLGLSMVYGFVKQSSGFVRIYSEVGEGTTIKVYLPSTTAEITATETTSERQDYVPGRGERVLVVEDDPDVRTLSVALLGSLGYHVMEAGTGETALILLDQTPTIDLLFTDVVLPGGMSGRQLAEEVERRRPGTKVLYTSGYTENSIVHQGRLDKGFNLLQKPFRKADLARQIRHALDH